MGRKSWFLIAAIGGTLIVVALGYVFRESWGDYPRNLGGPLAIVKGDPPKHGFLGVEFVDATGAPLTIQRVPEGTGAADAGLKSGDVILSAGSVEKPDFTAFQRVIKASAPGEKLLLKVGRGTDELEFRVRLISFTDMIVLRERERSVKTGP